MRPDSFRRARKTHVKKSPDARRDFSPRETTPPEARGARPLAIYVDGCGRLRILKMAGAELSGAPPPLLRFRSRASNAATDVFHVRALVALIVRIDPVAEPANFAVDATNKLTADE